MHNRVIHKEASDVAAIFGEARRFAEAFGMRFQALPLDDQHEARGVFDAALHSSRAAASVAANRCDTLLDTLREGFFFARDGLKDGNLGNHGSCSFLIVGSLWSLYQIVLNWPCRLFAARDGGATRRDAQSG